MKQPVINNDLRQKRGRYTYVADQRFMWSEKRPVIIKQKVKWRIIRIKWHSKYSHNI